MADPPGAKRARADAEPSAAPGGSGGATAANDEVPKATHVFVNSFDEPDHLVEVELRRLREANCRLYGHIIYDKPDGTCRRTGRKYWRSGMTRKMLSTFLRSLTLGYLSRGEGVSLEEAYAAFEYENVHVGIPVDRANEVRGLREPPLGVGFQKRRERLREELTRLCEEIANELVRWPRLEGALDAALRGGSACVGAATPTTAWVRFVPKPCVLSQSPDPLHELAHKPPRWLLFTLQVIGLVFYELVADKKLDPAARNEPSYSLLADELASRSSGSYFFARYDIPRHLQDAEFKRKWCVAGRWVNDIRTCITMNSAQPASASTGTRSVADMFKKTSTEAQRGQYARAVLGLAEHMLHSSAAPYNIFANMDDASASTWERNALAKALSARQIKILAWSGNGRSGTSPLRLPPHWGDSAAGPQPQQAAPEVAMLIDLSAIR